VWATSYSFSQPSGKNAELNWPETSCMKKARFEAGLFGIVFTSNAQRMICVACSRRRMIIIPPNAAPPRRRTKTPESMGVQAKLQPPVAEKSGS
jgi:hypothetical protein